MTHRIEPFFWTFSRWLKELKSFFNMTQRIEPFVFLKMSQRIELFFKKKTSKNWTSVSFELLFSWLNELNFFYIWLEELSLFKYDLKSWIFFEYHSKNWTFFLPRLERIEPFSFFEYDSKTWTFVWVWFTEVSLFFWTWLK